MNATLSWDANTAPDLAGYLAYNGTNPGVYGAPITVSAGVTTLLIAGLAEVTQYFAVKAYDAAGNQSAFSQEVSKAPIAFLLPSSMS